MSVLRVTRVTRVTRIILKRGVTRALPAALVLASLLTSGATANATANTVRVAGPSVEGGVRFADADGATKTLRFRAVTNEDGRTEGSMSFSGPAEIPDQDVDGAGSEGFSGAVSDLLIEARLDGLVTERNRAVMSGTVTASNLGEYIGRRVLLVVEDNGAAGRDRLTWGLYKPAAVDWTPSDYELGGEDNGALLTWTATDAERRDDEGIPMPRSTAIDCKTFPLAAHDFADTRDLEGDITVSQ